MPIEIKQLEPIRWEEYRNFRLAALSHDPLAFGSSYQEEKDLSKMEWCKRLPAMWFAFSQGKIVGMIGLLRRENTASLHCGCIVSLWVEPTHRSKGIAKLLLKKLQDRSESLGLRKISLQVTTTQTGAFALYKKLGFEEIGTLKENLYKDGNFYDEILMEWHANASQKKKIE